MKRSRSLWMSAISLVALSSMACGGSSNSTSGCPEGDHDGGDGRCVPDGSCSPGHHDAGNGACVSDAWPCASGFVVTGKNDLCCAEGYRDGGDEVCVPEGSCSPGYVENADGDCSPPSAEDPDAPDIEVPDRITAEASYQAKVKNPKESSTYTWTIEGGTLAADTGDSLSVTAGTSGAVIVSCVEINRAGASGPAGTATSIIVPRPTTPVITAPLAVVIEEEATAEVQEQPGMTYAWSIDNGELDGSADDTSVRFRATSSAPVRLSCTVQNELGAGIEGAKTVAVFRSSYPSLFGEVVTQVAAGGAHTCALTSAAGVWCWGNNENGQLGDGAIWGLPPTPVDVPGLASDDVVAIAAGGRHTCALTIEGGVRCWGDNTQGQLGDGTGTDNRVPVGVSGLASGVVAIAAGEKHACALTNEGGVRCWGDNEHGQLGDGTTTDRGVPVEVSGAASGVVAIATGGQHTCALTRAGGVRCWGYNGYGQLGDDTRTDRQVPVEVSGLASDVVAIAAGLLHTCALTNEGGVRCWGNNGYGQLGDGTTSNRTAPVGVPGPASGVVAIATGGYHTCALTGAGGVQCWGSNWYGQLGDGIGTNHPAPVDVPMLASGIAAITAGGEHACALMNEGSVRCWGRNWYGQLGDNTWTDRSAPVGVARLASGVDAITAGGEHTCALTSAGGVRCWGHNRFGQLGDGTTTDRSEPAEVSGQESGVGAIAAGERHACALTSVGGVRCWGHNRIGQLGDGTTTDRSTPAWPAAFGVVAIATGHYHTCALTKAGDVRCWGDNDFGQLGDWTTIDRSVPMDVDGLPSGIVAITAGSGHTCALADTGGVWCWGFNFYGQLGDGGTIDRAAPAKVFGLDSGVVAVAAGAHYTCALTSAGGVRCWGRNESGQLGDGTMTRRTVPTEVSGLASGVVAIAAGEYHACALTDAGGVRCWGHNDFGQLGDGTTTDRSAPLEVSGLESGVRAITAGGQHTCALSTAGAVRCWGSNADGQHGDGSSTGRSTPVAIGIAQGIVLSPPATAAAGAQLPLEELALASSGLEVTFDTWTPGVCSVSGTTLTIAQDVEEGALCGVIARQPGRVATESEGGSIAPAPDQTRIISIVKT